MNRWGLTTFIASFVREVAFADLALMTVVGAICWLVGARSLQGYVTGLNWAGLIVIALGLLCVLGDWGISHNSSSHPVSAVPTGRRLWQTLHKTLSVRFAMLLAMAGVVIGLIGMLLENL
jgi:hypothetical protein